MTKQLKKRLDTLARKAGQSPHAYVLSTLEEHVAAAELRERFFADGREAIAETERLGYAYDLQSVRAHQLAKVRGKPAPRLKKVRWS